VASIAHGQHGVSAVHPYSTEALALFEGLDEKVSRKDCAELVASGISLDVARLRGYATVEQVNVLRIGYGFADFQARVPGLLFPFHDVFGKQSGAVFKPMQPRMIGGKKQIKYEYIAGSRLMLDVPPTCQPDLGNPVVDLWITEGVKKGDALASQGRCAIDLPGVWGWLGTNPDGGKTALVDWREVALNDRKVFIAFDSDAADKPEVAQAEKELAAYLTARSAKVTIVRIPPAEDGSKQGIDDYLVGGGDLDALVLAAAPADGGAPDTKATIARLARLAPFEYEQERKAEADRLGVRVVALDAEVFKQRDVGAKAEANDVEPAAEEVDGPTLLQDLINYFIRYAVLPPHAALVLALWTIHTYALDAFDYTPRIIVKSPEPECGKTLVLELLAPVVRRPHQSENMTAATTFRRIEAEHPTLLIDEADTFLLENEGMRGILDSGFKRDGSVDRCVGDEHESKSFSTFSPAAIATLKKLAVTITKRSIEILMRRKLRTESRPRILLRKLAREGKPLASRCARWAKDHMEALSAVIEAHAAAEDPEALPFFKGLESLAGRQWDKWEVLLAIADEIGGGWGVAARDAAVALSGAQPEAGSYKTLLLRDLKALFETTGAKELSSKFICDRLAALEERPWNLFGKENPGPITSNGLSGMLRDYQVISGTIRPTYQPDLDFLAALKPEEKLKETAKGYKAKDFEDVFKRYTTADAADSPRDEPEAADPPFSAGTTSQPHGEKGNGDLFSRHKKKGVTDENQHSGYAPMGCDDVSVKKGVDGVTHAVDLGGDDDEEGPL
jgi:hypothetical protein